MPTNQRTHIAFLIDESGSMQGNEEAVVSGYNDFVASLLADAGDDEVLATLAMFDLRVDVPICRVKFDAVPLDELAPLTHADYRPHGSTPLNDAVLTTIEGLENKVRKSDRAMVIILTDGLENSSHASTATVRNAILAKERAGWSFIYLGANQDVWAEAHKYGLDKPGANFAFRSSTGGTASAIKAMSDISAAYVKDPDKFPDVAASLGDEIPEQGLDTEQQAKIDEAKKKKRAKSST